MAMELKGPIAPGPRVGASPAPPKYKGPVKAPGPRADKTYSGPETFDPVLMLTELLRNFNDSLTFGLYDKGVDAIERQMGGSGTRNQELTENSHPATKIIGQTLGGIPGGLGLERAVVDAVPALARNTLPMIAARGGIVNAGMSAADDWVRNQEIDPLGVGIDALMGSILSPAIAAGSRYISPGARVRAKGNDLTPADRDAGYSFSKAAQDRGILLDNAEALNAVAPERSADVAALKNSALDAPLATTVRQSFDAVRAPGIRKAGEQVVKDIGGLRSPVDISRAAQDAIQSVEGGFRATADARMAGAASKRIPPSHLPRNEAYAKAAGKVLNDPVAMEYLDDPVENSIAFLEEVRQNAARMSGRASSPAAANAFKATELKLDELLNKAGGRAGYTEARSIADEGARTIGELSDGPLGQIAKSTRSATQGGALFGVTNSAEAAAAKEAADHLPEFAQRGILANTIESTASKSPNGSIKKALPNEHAAGVASDIVGDNEIDAVIKMLNAVDERNIPVHQADDRSGPIGQIYSAFRDFGRDGVMKLMQDPEWIKRMGGMGPVQKAIQDLSLSLERESSVDDKFDFFDLPLY